MSIIINDVGILRDVFIADGYCYDDADAIANYLLKSGNYDSVDLDLYDFMLNNRVEVLYYEDFDFSEYKVKKYIVDEIADVDDSVVENSYYLINNFVVIDLNILYRC